MRLPRTGMRQWLLLVVVTAVVMSADRGVPAQAAEPRALCGKTVDGWIEVLRHGSSREREGAAWALKYFGPEAKKAVPDLIDYLRTRDVRHEPGAVLALGRIGPDAAQAIPLLTQGYLAEGCTLAKTGTFLSGSGRAPEDALVGIGSPAVPALIEILNGPNKEMQPCAAFTLGEIGPAAKTAVPALVRALQVEKVVRDDSDWRVLRYWAIVALGQIGPGAGEAAPALNTLLDRALRKDDADDTDEWPIVKALDQIGEPPVAKLIDAFVKEGGSEWGSDLARLGPRARAAVPTLRKALNDRRFEVRVEAAVALAAIEPPAPDAMTILIDTLEHHPEAADRVVLPLARLGPAAKAALPALLSQVTQDSAWIDPIEALVQIDPDGDVCVPALIAALSHKDSDVVAAAAKSLGVLGPRARPAVSALAKTLARNLEHPFGGEGDPLVEAAKALSRIGPAAQAAIPALIEAVKLRRFVRVPGGLFETKEELDFEHAAAAARVLGTFGPAAKGAVPVLIEALQTREKDDESWELRREAALALGRIGPEAKAAVPALRKRLEEPSSQTSRELEHGIPPQVGDAAAVALFFLAPDGKQVARSWTERLNSPERRAFVLGGIGTASVEGELVGRIWLEDLKGVLAQGERVGDELLYVEWYFERLGSLGVGARLAIPRLGELQRHRNPWIRQWATETLERIEQPVKPSPFSF